MRLEPAGIEGKKLILWIIQSSCLPEQMKVNTQAPRDLDTLSSLTIRNSWAKSLFWAEVQRDDESNALNYSLPALCNITESQSTTNQIQNWNEDTFPLTCSSNTVKSHESIKTRGCPWEDSFQSIGHKPSNTVEFFLLCLTKRHGTELEVILSRWE